jgi:putative transposase
MQTKGRLNPSRTRRGKGSMMLNPTNVVQPNLPLFATVGSVQSSNETILSVKSNLCEKDTLTLKSSKTLGADSTLKEKDCSPYWSDLCAAISSRLLLPVDSDLNYSSSWQNKTVGQSWFSTNLYTAQKPNSQPIFCPSFAECPDSGATARKSRKIRIFPSAEQRALLKQWFGVSRFVYNETIKYLQTPGTKANWKAIKTGILQSLPEWAKPVPYQIKSIAIKDACQAVKQAKKGFKNDGKIRKCRFRSRKDTQQSIYIPKEAIKDCGVYHTILGRLKLKENLPKDFSDGRLTLAYGEYYLTVSEEVQPLKTENQGRVVALDPGVRTFMTFFSESSYGWLGKGANLLIQKLCFKLDKLSSKMSKACSAQKQRFRKASHRLRAKIQHLVKELHHKVAKFLVDNFDVILMPSFESSQMVSKSRRKIGSKTVRQMLSLSHYQFKQHLE